MTREDAKSLSEPRRGIHIITEDHEAIRVTPMPESEVIQLIWDEHQVEVIPVQGIDGGYIEANYFHPEIALPGTLGDYYLNFAFWDDVSNCGRPLLAGPFKIEHLHRYVFNPQHFLNHQCGRVLDCLERLSDWKDRKDEMDYARSLDAPDDEPEPEPELLTEREADLLDWKQRRSRGGRPREYLAPAQHCEQLSFYNIDPSFAPHSYRDVPRQTSLPPLSKWAGAEADVSRQFTLWPWIGARS